MGRISIKSNSHTALDKVSKAKNAALSNCKKAIAFGESILEGPSGKKREDWIKEVLDRMYEDIYGLTHGSLDGDGEDTPVRPNGWFFSGFFAVLAMGPLAPANFQSNVLVTGELPKTSGEKGVNDKNSRAGIRREKAMKKHRKRYVVEFGARLGRMRVD